jgi:hypothetical protein
MVSPLRTRLEASTVGITQTLRSRVRSGLIEAADALIDMSGEAGGEIKGSIWVDSDGGLD